MWGIALLGGEGEIRTRGELPHACFQDKYLKPLGHLSRGSQTIVTDMAVLVERLAGDSRNPDSSRARPSQSLGRMAQSRSGRRNIINN